MVVLFDTALQRASGSVAQQHSSRGSPSSAPVAIAKRMCKEKPYMKPRSHQSRRLTPLVRTSQEMVDQRDGSVGGELNVVAIDAHRACSPFARCSDNPVPAQQVPRH